MFSLAGFLPVTVSQPSSSTFLACPRLGEPAEEVPVLEGAPGVLAAGEGREALLGVPVATDTPCRTRGRMCTCNGADVGDAWKWLLSVARL